MQTGPQTSRDNPWDQRNANFEDVNRFQNLIDLHTLTRQWILDLKVDDSEVPHRLIRVLSPAAHEAQKVFDILTETSLPQNIDQILDESHPVELLERLEAMVWTVQFWLLRSLKERTSPDEHSALKVSLEQSSWNSGHRNAEARWNAPQHPRRTELSALFSALKGGPLSRYPEPHGFILKRELWNEIQFELAHCPHVHKHSFGHPPSAVDELCYLHSFWIKGFVYAFHPLVRVNYEPRSSEHSRCSMTWNLLEH